jgi:hypothetical protein
MRIHEGGCQAAVAKSNARASKNQNCCIIPACRLLDVIELAREKSTRLVKPSFSCHLFYRTIYYAVDGNISVLHRAEHNASHHPLSLIPN